MFIRRAQQICALSVVICLAMCSASASGATSAWHVSAQHRGGIITDFSCSKLELCGTVGIGLLPAVIHGQAQLWHSPFRKGIMTAVDCRAGRCLAVGVLGKGYVVRWDRGTHLGKLKHIGKGFGDSLTGVSCPSRSDCFAVGSTLPYLSTCVHATKRLTLSQIDRCLSSRPALLHRSGHHWHVNSSFPLPRAVERAAAKGVVNAGLDHVACSSTRSCEVVGHWQARTLKADKRQLYAAHWDGRRWTVQHVPNRSGPSWDIHALACVRAGQCMAVGVQHVHKRSKPVALRYNGKRWSAMHVSIPSGLKGAFFAGVSCGGVHQCMVVGGQQRAHHPLQPLAELWTAGRWVVQQVPLPHTRGPHYLMSVDCLSTTSCLAAGNDDRRIGIDDILGWFLERYRSRA